MNKLENTQKMTFEIFEPDLVLLQTHASLAAASGSIDNRKIAGIPVLLERRYLQVQIPQLYKFCFIENWKNMEDYGGRTHTSGLKIDPSKITTFEFSLNTETAEKYYRLQHRYSRLWVINTLLNIYEYRQEVVERREKAELTKEAFNFKFKFIKRNWLTSYLLGKKRYHINARYPIDKTIREFQELEYLKPNAN